MTILQAIGIYLITGLVAITALDMITGRVRHKLREAAYDSQNILINANIYVGNYVSILVISLAIWAFWPALIYGAIESVLRRGDNDKSD